MDWVLNPFLAYAIEAIGLCMCLYLFLSAKCEARRREVRLLDGRTAFETGIEELRLAVNEVKSTIHEQEESSGMLVPPAPSLSGLNLNKRTQALRMHRRGETPEKIAAVLLLPRREVELLVKLQKIAVDRR